MFLIQFFIVASDVGKEDLTVDRIPMQFFIKELDHLTGTVLSV
jgi:hypothetical protein